MKNYPIKYDLKELFKIHEEGWLKMNQYKDQLYIFCYSPKCQYEKFWTPLTLSMRGMVLGREGEVIGQCLPKFFNLSEVPETRAENLPREDYEIFQKVDGSMISTFYNPYEERWQHTSKCSFENEYIEAAYRFLPPKMMANTLPLSIMLTSEVRFDTDPMRRVTDTHEGLYLITSWCHSWVPPSIGYTFGAEWARAVLEGPRTLSEALSSCLDIGIVSKYDDKLENKLESFNSEKDTEGYVVRFESGFRTKLKTAWYLQLNKVLDDFGPGKARETVKEYLTNYDMTMDWVKYLPDEMWQEAEDIAGQILEDYNNQIYWVDRYFHRNYSKDKKTFALAVKDLPEAPYLFSKYKDPEGEAYKKLIWKNI